MGKRRWKLTPSEVVEIVLAMNEEERRNVARRLAKNKKISDGTIKWLLGLHDATDPDSGEQK
jgi:hypothetical protein